MGLFGPSSPFDTDVEKATSETNTSEQWDVIIDICDKVGSNSKNAKDCIRSIMRRMGHNDPHVAIQAITLLDACIKNCGQKFHLEIASRDFENEFRRLMSKSPAPVAQKMRVSLKKWADGEFKSDPQLNLIPTLYQKLKSEGLDFTDTSVPQTKPQPVLSKDPNVVSSQQEEDDIAKAIELSLKEGKKDGGKAPSSSYPSLYPSTTLNSTQSTKTEEARKVRALYDFEAAEDNELTFLAGEIIHVLDDTDPNWWKGYNDRGEGLFPSNFVTADLSAEPESTRHDTKKKSVTFSNNSIVEDSKPEAVEIDEEKIDRLLYLLHEANPEDPSQDPEEMFILEAQVNQMLPLIDSELERVDRNHAKLTQLSSNLVDAINMYHTLMRDADLQLNNYNVGQMVPPMYRQNVQPNSGMYNVPPNMYSFPPNYTMLQVGHQFPPPTSMVNNMQPPFQGGNPQQAPMQHVQPHHSQPQFQYASEQQSQQHLHQSHPSSQSHQPQPQPQATRVDQPPIIHQHGPQVGPPATQISYPPPGNIPQANFINMAPINNQHSSALPISHPNVPMSGYLPNTVMTTQVQPGASQPPHNESTDNSQSHYNTNGQSNLSPIHNLAMMQNHLAVINQPVTTTILPQTDSRSNIPIYQEQR